MPIRFLRRTEEEPTVEVGRKSFVERGLPASLEFFRGPSPWRLIMERSYVEAMQKLIEIVKQDLKIEGPDVAEMIPCLVDLKEAKSKTEEERIRLAHKRMAGAFSSLVDRLGRYRPESIPYAFDQFKQDIIDGRPLIAPYECDTFRPRGEVDGGGKKRRKKKSSD